MLLLMMVSALHAQFKTNYNLSRLSQPDFTVTERNNDGSIKSVRYAPTDPNIPASANEFFNNTLKKRDADDFILDRSKDTDYGMHFERYQQYYHGIIVDDGHYNFRFKNGRMKVVTGHHVNVSNIDPVPYITEEEAIKQYAAYFKFDKEGIIESRVNLMIKEIPNADSKESKAFLTYKVFLFSLHNLDGFVGYIDAHTGELVYKENAFIDYSATGQFYTFYNRNANDVPKIGTTSYSNNEYQLIDSLRGHGIMTGTYDGVPSFFHDNDNVWTRNEMGSLNIALDTHWTMERIYDLMVALFHHNSYDGQGCQVLSIINTSETARYYFNYDCFLFGNATGSSIFNPLASVDVIGHEYGHAILDKTTHIDSNQNATIHEGLADIWGIILENNITPNADCWKIGEQIMINGSSCLRNFQNPNDATAFTQISNTCGCGLYYSQDPHVAGGLLPYWFYLLVNGGSGTNGYNNSYQLIPVGFELAEQLFEKATLHPAYLEDCSSFLDVAISIMDAADDMDNDFMSEQVQNSLYAVGLYSEPLHIYQQSYGTNSATYYVYGNPDCTVNWNITNGSGPMPTLVPNNDFSCTVYKSSPSSFSGILNATINCGGCSVTYSKSIYLVANPSSLGDEMMQVIPIDKSHYQLSYRGKHEDGYITVYDANSLQLKNQNKLARGNYILDTSSWEHGLYIIEITIGNKKYRRKLNI